MPRRSPGLVVCAVEPCLGNWKYIGKGDSARWDGQLDLEPVLATPSLNQGRYCSSLTFSIHSTALPSSFSWIAMCVIAVVAVAPCQCFSPGGIQTTSPGRISSIGPPQ